MESWMVDAAGSMPAKIPLYRTSEWEMSDIGFLGRSNEHAGGPCGRVGSAPDETESHCGQRGWWSRSEFACVLSAVSPCRRSPNSAKRSHGPEVSETFPPPSRRRLCFNCCDSRCKHRAGLIGTRVGGCSEQPGSKSLAQNASARVDNTRRPTSARYCTDMSSGLRKSNRAFLRSQITFG